MTTYVFPGQGSQSRGMEGTLFSEFPTFTEKADQILGYSIATLCQNDPNEQLNKTEYTQPALFIVNALSYLKKFKEAQKKPDYVAGHSLGEYNALFAADVFDFETGLKLVQKRGQLMSQAENGSMAAVIGLKSDVVSNILSNHHITDIVIANFNSYTQTVISGSKSTLSTCESLFINEGAKLFIPLKVSGAFHSPLMEKAEHEFSNFLRGFSFSSPTIPVISNITARPYKESEIELNLSRQITHPVQWTQTIEYLIGQGEKNFEEIGPGKVLTGLIRRIQQGQ